VFDSTALADAFFHAFYSNTWRIEDSSVDGLSVLESYQIQNLVCEKRIELGESVVGYKVGCTSHAIRSQFGISEPISGRLFAPHVQGEGMPIDRMAYANCAIEPEMVFTMGCDLFGSDFSDQELIEAIDHVSPGIELHNYRFWHQPPSLQELICSGGIHAGLIVGNRKVSADALNFKHEAFSVYQDKKLITSAPASEIMGGPLESLRWLVNSLSSSGEGLKSGSMVIPGSPTELIEINHDSEIQVVIENLGQVSATFHS
jgi:2-keto-4-pentenoate hydratase